MKRTIMIIAGVLVSASLLLLSAYPTYATELPECECKQPQELILLGGNCVNKGDGKVMFCEEVQKQGGTEGETENGMMFVIRMVLNIMLAGVGIIGTISIIWCGVLVLTARDNEAQVAAARKRFIDVVIGIAALWLSIGIVELLLPGGKEHKDLLPNPEDEEPETSYVINIG